MAEDAEACTSIIEQGMFTWRCMKAGQHEVHHGSDVRGRWREWGPLGVREMDSPTAGRCTVCGQYDAEPGDPLCYECRERSLGPRVVIEVDGWGACTVMLHGDGEPLRLHYFYSTTPSRQHLPAAQEWVRRLGELLGVALEVEVRDAAEVSRSEADEWSDWAPTSVEGWDEGSEHG